MFVSGWFFVVAVFFLAILALIMERRKRSKIPVLLYTFFFFLIFFSMARSKWIRDVQIEWRKDVNSVVCSRKFDISIARWDEMDNCLYGPNKMMFYFWRWDVEKMVENRELYNDVKEMLKEVYADDVYTNEDELE